MQYNAHPDYDAPSAAGRRITPQEGILAALDEQLKRLTVAVGAVGEKLSSLDCTAVAGEAPKAEPLVEPYQYNSAFMRSLEDRQRQIGELATRLAQINAKTEL